MRGRVGLGHGEFWRFELTVRFERWLARSIAGLYKVGAEYLPLFPEDTKVVAVDTVLGDITFCGWRSCDPLRELKGDCWFNAMCRSIARHAKMRLICRIQVQHLTEDEPVGKTWRGRTR